MLLTGRKVISDASSSSLPKHVEIQMLFQMLSNADSGLTTGKPEAYNGEAVSPKHLSWYEGLRRLDRYYLAKPATVEATADPIVTVTAPAAAWTTEAQKRHVATV